jgi:hypothetical protein
MLQNVHRESGFICRDVSDLCLGCARFDSRSGQRMSRLRLFMVFLNLSRKMPGQYPKLE